MPYYVYILASKKNGTLYIGVTNDIARRIAEHKAGTGSTFTRKYGVHLLVYVETHDSITDAIARDKAMKEWQRAWKIRQIEAANPEWRDLTGRLNQ